MAHRRDKRRSIDTAGYHRRCVSVSAAAVAAFLLMLPHTQAWAWGSEGHRIIADIAWDHLNDATIANCGSFWAKTIWHPSPPGQMTFATVGRRPAPGTMWISLRTPAGTSRKTALTTTASWPRSTGLPGSWATRTAVCGAERGAQVCGAFCRRPEPAVPRHGRRAREETTFRLPFSGRPSVAIIPAICIAFGIAS